MLQFEKQCEFLRCHVDEYHRAAGKGTFAIRIGISIDDPFQDENLRGIALCGLLTKTGVVVDSEKMRFGGMPLQTQILFAVTLNRSR